ncbi:hypothetical protein B0F90DRAFT_1813403 [Multifurca ochricompacta]|uniref:Uncharacterized protein n=1 Tax=Multifurca ochricompacta TaxID=376703 RepID=A0AAD4QU79_9AGAM|nr:hypothetical protein B0F90DRAFT_1813403 [Multifurca ochricompacta]
MQSFPFEYHERPIQISPSPDFINNPPYSSSFCYGQFSSILSLRAAASASTPSVSSIDTPVHEGERLTVHPIIADESSHSLLDATSYSYSGQYPPQPQLPPDNFNLPFAALSAKPSSNGVIHGHQALVSAPLHCHRVMSQVFNVRLWVILLAPSTSPIHNRPAHPSLLHRARSETTMTLHYDLTTSTTKTIQTSTTTTTMTVLQSAVPSANVCTVLTRHPAQTCPPRHASQPPPPVQSKLSTDAWQFSNTSSFLSFPSFMTPTTMAPLPAASVPLYHPRPMRPLPEWAKKSSPIPDELTPEVSLNSDPTTMLTHGIFPLPRASGPQLGENWNYEAPVAGATIREMIDSQETSRNDDDEDDFDDDEYYDYSEDTDMEGTEGEFEMENRPTTPEFRTSPSCLTTFYGTLSSAANLGFEASTGVIVRAFYR